MPGAIVKKGNFVYKQFITTQECQRVFNIYNSLLFLNIPNILRPEYIKPSTLKF